MQHVSHNRQIQGQNVFRRKKSVNRAPRQRDSLIPWRSTLGTEHIASHPLVQKFC